MFLRTAKCFMASLLLLCMVVLVAMQNGCAATQFPDGKGKRLVLCHYMPCFPAIRPGSTSVDAYGYQYEFNPKNEPAKAGRSSRSIMYATTTGNADDVALQATIAEIRIAKQGGIDGFFVDLLWDQPSYIQQWQRLLKAAEIVGDFYIGLMPDYACLGKPSEQPKQAGSPPSREMILHWLQVASNSPALLRYDGKPVVAPYGDGFPDGKWVDLDKNLLVDWLASQGMPVSFITTQGADWNSFYQQDFGKAYADFAVGAGSFSPNVSIANRNRLLAYWPQSMFIMGEVSPIYYNRGWNYSATRGTTMFRDAWMWNIEHRDRVQWIQAITWNDYGETPLVPENNHFSTWLPLMRYYSDWFKTGKQPMLKEDFLAVFHRQHPYTVEPTTYKYKVKSNVPTDEMEAIAILTKPATLVINTGEKTYRQEFQSGVQSFMVPFQLGVQSARIERNGKVVCTVTTPVPIHDKPIRENLWFIAADSAHPPRQLSTTEWEDVRGEWKRDKRTVSGSGLTVTGDEKTWSDYTITATLLPQFTSDEQQVGIAGRVYTNRYYQFTFDRQGHWKIARSNIGKLTVISEGSFPYRAGDSVKLALSCVGEHLIGYINGALVDANGYDFDIPYGKVGILADETSTEVKDFSVVSYDPDLANLK